MRTPHRVGVERRALVAQHLVERHVGELGADTLGEHQRTRSLRPAPLSRARTRPFDAPSRQR